MTTRLAIVFATAICAAGCISKRSGNVTENDPFFTEGVTTKRDALEAWGNPDAIRDDVWIWRENRHLGGKIKASYRGVGLTVSSVKAATCEHHLKFDDSGRLVSRETHHSVPGGAGWSIIPW